MTQAEITVILATCAAMVSKSCQEGTNFEGLSVDGKIFALSSLARSLIAQITLNDESHCEFVGQFYQKIVRPWTE